MKIVLEIPGYTIQTPNSIRPTSLNNLLSLGVTLLMVGAVILTLFFLIYGGISFITSGGDKQKVVQARLKLTYAVVGLIVVFLSFFIINLIGTLFGVKLL